MQALENQYRVTLLQRLKQLILQTKSGNKLVCNGNIRILGKLPIFKLHKGARIILGNKVVLNSDFAHSNTALTNRCVLACGKTGIIEIGDNSMFNGVSITAYQRVRIGRNCQIASNTFITDTDFHPVDPETRERQVLGYKIDFKDVGQKEVKIGDNVWVGWGAIILKGVTIGDNSIIGAGSVVVNDIPPNSLASGIPAVVKKEYVGADR